MKVVLDTNVVISAVYFGGAPLKILKAWRDGQLDLVVTDDILAEYDEIANRLHARYPAVDFQRKSSRITSPCAPLRRGGRRMRIAYFRS